MLTFFFGKDMKVNYILILILLCLNPCALAQTNNEPWKPQLGRDYQAITPSKTNSDAQNVNSNSIQLYFWAGSPSSYQLDLALQNWLINKQAFNLQRIPLVKRPNWRLLAKTWLVVEQFPIANAFLNRLYEAIHVDRTDILTFNDLLPIINEYKLDELEFKTSFYSLAINHQLNTIQKSAQLFPIHTVPTIIINNKWSIDASTKLSADQFISIIEQLTKDNYQE